MKKDNADLKTTAPASRTPLPRQEQQHRIENNDDADLETTVFSLRQQARPEDAAAVSRTMTSF
jgi:hypothetical protein